jgi:phenylalanyl-tRNA synthetase beta chain
VDVELITSVEVFDEYRGKQIPEGFRSLSIRLTLRDKEKTLTDERIDALVDSVVKLLIQECQIQMR